LGFFVDLGGLGVAKFLRKLSLLCFVCFLVTTRVGGITPEEVFQDGRRAFELGHWAEAKEHFYLFGQSWPSHPLVVQALLLESLSELRARPAEDTLAKADRLASLSVRLKLFREKLPGQELSELETALQVETSGASLLATGTGILAFPPKKLDHLLNRNLIQNPSQDPIGTLSWIRQWRRRYPSGYPAGLVGKLEMMRSKALWILLLSPLPARKSSAILKTWGAWPLGVALNRSLNKAFQDGSLDVKREASVLGVSVDWILKNRKENQGLQEDSKWMRYLRERGIHEAEAWVPR